MKSVKIARGFEELRGAEKKALFTIGTFDGLHLGHQRLLTTAKELAVKGGSDLLVATFTNHPAEVLQGLKRRKPLFSPERRIALFDELGVDLLLLLPFTEELSKLTALEFLKKIADKIPLSALLLGYDAAFGSDRREKGEAVEKAAEAMQIDLYRVPPYCVGGAPVSTRRIRKLLEEGRDSEAEVLLGRPLEQHPEKSPHPPDRPPFGKNFRSQKTTEVTE